MLIAPLVFALVVILIAAVVLAIWPGMEPTLKRMFLIVVAVIVVASLLAAFWPIFGGSLHGRIG